MFFAPFAAVDISENFSRFFFLLFNFLKFNYIESVKDKSPNFITMEELLKRPRITKESTIHDIASSISK